MPVAVIRAHNSVPSHGNTGPLTLCAMARLPNQALVPSMSSCRGSKALACRTDRSGWRSVQLSVARSQIICWLPCEAFGTAQAALNFSG